MGQSIPPRLPRHRLNGLVRCRERQSASPGFRPTHCLRDGSQCRSYSKRRQHRQTVLTAFEEVETCLSTLRILAEQSRAEARAVDLAHQGVEIALNEYQAGLQSYTAVVTAQQIELSNRETQLQVELNRLLQTVALIKALGGGWHSGGE
jgi:outer membrane protein TolC